ncbi:MAG: zinc metallopeptidase [Gammaproteobacteria bacterium]|jgi:Zn-dependent membrane protease YugP
MYIILGLVLLIGSFLPQIWAKRIIKLHSNDRPDIPGTGAELAIFLIQKALPQTYQVEIAASGVGDHFNPKTKSVVLSESIYHGRSLSAVVISAHEVGHAIQDHIGFGPLKTRTKLVHAAFFFERMASIILIAAPIVTLLTRAPMAGAGLLAIAICSMILPIGIHLITLPVEIDASFNRALPILRGRFLDDADLPAARKILTVCALTYVAASLASLLNVWKWLRLLKR